MDIIEQLSTALSARVADAQSFAVAIAGGRRACSGIVWRPDVVVTSEQMLGDASTLTVLSPGVSAAATIAGRDPGTNVAVLRLATPMAAADLPPVAHVTTGALALAVGADAGGRATGRLAMVHSVSEAWHSMAGGRIDAMIRLGCRLASDEGGPVLSAAGGLLGMATSGPRRRTIVIPAATLTRIIDPLLAEGRIARGWLGVALQPVLLPDTVRPAGGPETGLMVIGLTSNAPGDVAGLLPGDILLDVDGTPVERPHRLAALLDPDRIGGTIALRILRAGAQQTVTATVAARPAS